MAAQFNKPYKSPAEQFKDYAQDYADRVKAALEQGTAPWIRPWRAGVVGLAGQGMPYNAITGVGYSGSNVWILKMVQDQRGFEDDRWLTFKQAMDLGCRVAKGAKGVQCVKWVKVENKDLKVPEGPVYLCDALEIAAKRSRMVPKFFYVYNAAEIDGIPAAPVREAPKEQERHAQCKALIDATGALIEHDGGNRAYYRPSTDSIHLPLREAFVSEDAYYATVLHELGHWTGFPTRLNRNLKGEFGSKDYAREELRAEMASMMIGDRLGIGHDPGQHVAYIGHWIKLIEEQPREILLAARDAEAICQHLGVRKYEHEPMQVSEQAKDAERVRQLPKDRPRTRRHQRQREQVAAVSL